MTLAAAAKAVGGVVQGRNVRFASVVTDSRRVSGGELFVALRGPHFDGHDFVGEAAAAGAVAAMVSRTVSEALPCLTVDDTRRALGRLAAHWRSRFALPVIAVTGSNGKTTVKEMIGAILSGRAPTLATEGNLNNDIGVPLMLLRLRETHRFAALELGMNRPGEIGYLSQLVRPTVALITNAAEAHLEGLGSVAAVARAKGEIFSGLKPGGVAVVNADDPHAPLWRRLAAPNRCIGFGLEGPAEISARYTPDADGSRLHLKTPKGEITMRLPLPGKHNVMNALAATAAATEAGADLEDVKRGLEKLRAVAGRLEPRRGLNGARVLDDTYNANPASVAAGLDVLRGHSGETVLVLGDMAELGPQAPALHRRIGELAKRLGVTRLFALGALSAEAAAGFGAGGEHFDTHEALAEALRPRMHPAMTVLVKGSRASRMERVVAAICEQRPSGADAD